MKKIMMNRVKIAGLVIIPLMIALTSCTQKKAGSVQTSGLLITITNPVQTVFTKWDEYPGHVESIEYVELRPRVSGYIDSIHFKDGAEVKVGDLLFIVDPKPYEAELERANAELERAKSALEQARAEKARTATQLELAKNDLQRAEGLRPAKAISEEEYDLRAKTYRSMQSAFDAATAAVSVAESSVSAAQASVKTAQLNLGYTKITAPISGKISDRHVTVGNLVQAGGVGIGTVLATIVTIDPIYCYFDVDERAFLKYRKLALIAGSVEKPTLACEAALDGEDGFPHKGIIDFFDNKLDASTGTIRMRGVFKNQDRALIHGNFARIRIPVERLDSAILIPEEAILSEQTRKYVYVLNSQDMTVQQRNLTLGPLQGMNRVILSGLSPNDTIAKTGILMLRPGAKVQILGPSESSPAPAPQQGKETNESKTK